ncbi:hypothetical protein NQ318_003605 [Aromia moschata]|uniref:PDZ domain-containing protein n=1 Tax=Aromia moschata TaxID=1265417 RepID=A0AAV8YWX3_9CUCU|nr:hypothetical protein NQ318_003605 [Aromia moschata]
MFMRNCLIEVLPLLPTRDPTSPLPPRQKCHLKFFPECTSGYDVFTFENFNVFENTAGTGTSVGTVATHYELLFQMQQTPGPSSRNIDRQLEANRNKQRSASCSPRILQATTTALQNVTGTTGSASSKGNATSSGDMWLETKGAPDALALHIGDRLLSIEGINIKSAAEA